MRASAAYFQFSFDETAVRRALKALEQSHIPVPAKVRLTLAQSGEIAVTAAPLAPLARWRLGLAAAPVARDDVFLYHKTTHRAIYQEALAGRPDCDDVLLWNEDGELTESCIGNIALRIDGQWQTPPISAGLLGGVFRTALLNSGELVEARLMVADLKRATAIRLVNSVRERWTPQWVERSASAGPAD